MLVLKFTENGEEVKDPVKSYDYEGNENVFYIYYFNPIPGPCA